MKVEGKQGRKEEKKPCEGVALLVVTALVQFFSFSTREKKVPPLGASGSCVWCLCLHTKDACLRTIVLVRTPELASCCCLRQKKVFCKPRRRHEN